MLCVVNRLEEEGGVVVNEKDGVRCSQHYIYITSSLLLWLHLMILQFSHVVRSER